MTARHENDLRRLNERLNYWEKFYNMEVLKSFPTFIDLPTGERCNLRCVFCTDRSDKQKDRYKNFSFLQIKEMVDKVQVALNFTGTIGLYGWGEPLFNEDYSCIFDYVTNRFPGLSFFISTNGTLLNKEWALKMVSHGKIMINISINAATRQTYKKVMRADFFETVRGNIQGLISLKRKKKVDDMQVFLSFVAVKHNIKELPLLIEMAHELGVDGVILQDLMFIEDDHQRLSLIDEPETAYYFFALADKKARELGVKFTSYVTYAVDYFRKKEQISPGGSCYDPWQNFKVASNGDVVPCCRSDRVMGNIFIQNFDEIWNGDIYRYYRRTINTSRPPDECSICPVKIGGA